MSMSNPADLMTQMILAQITDLQRRVTLQDGTIASLKAEVDRLSGNTNTGMRRSVPISYNNDTSLPNGNDNKNRGTYRTDNRVTIPLTPAFTSTHRGGDRNGDRDGNRNGNRNGDNKYNDKRKKPQVASVDERAPPIELSALLKEGEKVTLSIGVGRDVSGSFLYTTCNTTFTGGQLVVSECEKVASLVGEKSDKPGTLLYKFMTELKNGNHIQNMFKIAPWKLCSVVRDGKTLTLEDLKATM